MGTNWNPESEISRFNAHRGTDDFSVSDESAAVVAYAVEVSEKSDGVFDCTVGPLVALWGFGNRAHVDSRPSDEDIEALRGGTVSRWWKPCG
jgi:thiamine biosynthesis lipoprotein